MKAYYDNNKLDRYEFGLTNTNNSAKSYIKDIEEHYNEIGTYSASAFMEMELEGQIYKGQCKDSGEGLFLPHGLGTATYNYPPEYLSKFEGGPNKKEGLESSIYVGEWKKGNREGYGSIKSPNGAGYSGYWKENLFHGKGKQLTILKDTVCITDGEWNMNELIQGTQQWEVEKIVIYNAMGRDELLFDMYKNESFDSLDEDELIKKVQEDNFSKYYLPDHQAKECFEMLPEKIQKRVKSNNGQILTSISKIEWANFKRKGRSLEWAEYITNIVIKSNFNNDVPVGIGEVRIIGLLAVSVFQYDFDKNELIEEETYFDTNNRDINWDTSHIADFPNIVEIDENEIMNAINETFDFVMPLKGKRYLSDNIKLIKDKYLLDENM